jgi:uncharacterized Fe-S cluster-containing radical SAM superfamily protein
MTGLANPAASALDPAKFRDPDITTDGARRASVALDRLETLWFNTGTLCNLTCRNCYIASSPHNDRLAYITLDEVVGFLDTITPTTTREIGLTGGEPFMNPEVVAIIEAGLARGHAVLVLTNAMRPMMKCAAPLLALKDRFGDRLTIRVSLDHYSPDLHEIERGARTWAPTLKGLAWLIGNGFNIHIAGRTCWDEDEPSLRAGYGRLFAQQAIPFDADDPVKLMLFPEMHENADVPEITEACWGILDVAPGTMMCATSRMVVKRKGEAPSVVACTLLPYDRQFDLGPTLDKAAAPVKLNHPHCARFCVLGGAACSR